jgi:hypothetical protein
MTSIYTSIMATGASWRDGFPGSAEIIGAGGDAGQEHGLSLPSLSAFSQLAGIHCAVYNVLPVFPQTNKPGMQQLTGGEAWTLWHSARFNKHNHLNLLSFFAGKPCHQDFSILLDYCVYTNRLHNFVSFSICQLLVALNVRFMNSLPVQGGVGLELNLPRTL